MARIYTRRGDGGETGRYLGGRVAKDAAGPEAYGTVDEAVAALALARAFADGAVADAILRVQRELFVVAAELATTPERRDDLEPGISRPDADMVAALEARIDELVERHGAPREFVVPGGSPVGAALDLARTIVRRAERRAVAYQRETEIDGSFVVPYLNRLADYLFMLARSTELEWTPTRQEEE
ncbi:MAG TPA: cob(I)yrinic acid a,c-diamide adenosyltransferase [Actinobacteria bacterium]|nr:cob(I)yrinic acid a,c-diamide adenosyltransferase [Actinomycetota bacterium]